MSQKEQYIHGTHLEDPEPVYQHKGDLKEFLNMNV